MNLKPATLALMLMFLPAMAAQAQAQAFQITASIKTLATTKSERQDLPRGSTRVVEEEKVLAMQIRRTNPNVGASVEVRWLVFMEEINGRTRPAVFGRQQIAAPVGIPTELQSEPFSLREREFNGKGDARGSLEQTVKGFGILIVDENGVELGSKFSAASVEAALRKEFAAIAAREAEGADSPDKAPRRDRPKRRL